MHSVHKKYTLFWTAVPHQGRTILWCGKYCFPLFLWCYLTFMEMWFQFITLSYGVLGKVHYYRTNDNILVELSSELKKSHEESQSSTVPIAHKFPGTHQDFWEYTILYGSCFSIAAPTLTGRREKKHPDLPWELGLRRIEHSKGCPWKIWL